MCASRRMNEKLKASVLERDSAMCQYCGEIADGIDHIIPFPICRNHEIENLVAACFKCNLVAGTNLFSDFKEKKKWILEKRRKSRNIRVKLR